MIGIVDYGVGNLFSLASSLNSIGGEYVITNNAEELLNCSSIILPGVGAFGDAANKLRAANLDIVLKEAAKRGTPLLGICLGMQLLFEESCEFGKHAGLGLIKGGIISLQDAFTATGTQLKVPHMGWNTLVFAKLTCQLLKYVHEGDAVYYVHSYYAANCEENTAAYSEYGVNIPGVVHAGNVYGTQFHPEKSGDVGLSILKAFLEVSA